MENTGVEALFAKLEMQCTQCVRYLTKARDVFFRLDYFDYGFDVFVLQDMVSNWRNIMAGRRLLKLAQVFVYRP